MKPHSELPPSTRQLNTDLWAYNSIRDMVAGCILNIRLKEAGICDKYLCEMSDVEVERYLVLIEELRRIMVKKLQKSI